MGLLSGPITVDDVTESTEHPSIVSYTPSDTTAALGIWLSNVGNY